MWPLGSACFLVRDPIASWRAHHQGNLRPSLHVGDAAEYDKALKTKADKDPDYVDRSWKDDRIEATRRAWKWWEAKHSKLTYFSIAARLVALVPISSASVERVFSQVKYIVETCGENGLQETIETRLMERVNVYD